MEEIDTATISSSKTEMDNTANSHDQSSDSLSILKHGHQNIHDIEKILDNNEKASNGKNDTAEVLKPELLSDSYIKAGISMDYRQDLPEVSIIKLENNKKPELPEDTKPESMIKSEQLLEDKKDIAKVSTVTLENNTKPEQPKDTKQEPKEDVKPESKIKSEQLLEDKKDIGKVSTVTLEDNTKPEQPKDTKQEPKEDVKHDGTTEGRVSFEKDHIEKHYDKVSRKRHWILGAIGRIFGVEYAPINIPISRRMETFGVTFWMSTFLFMGFGSLGLLIYMFLYTKYWWFSLAYFTWYLGDRSICNRGGRRWGWVRHWKLWKHMGNFFPAHLIKTTELDPSHNYIMGYHPHGILSAGGFVHYATEGTGFSKVFPGLTPYLLTLTGHFHLPFYREFFMCSGSVSATRESMDFLLGREGTGRALCLVVGGAKESLDCHPGQVILHLSKRKGFCKMALRHGAHLVPMFSFGENDIYDQIHNPEGSTVRKIQNWLQKVIGLAPCVVLGRGVFQYSLGFVPYRRAIYTVVGAPIEVPHVQYPSKEQIVELHAKYVEAIKELYDKYKHKYAADPSVEIQIV